MSKPTPNSCRAIIVKDDGIILMHRIEKGVDYYCFPGGGVEPKETAEAALLREIKEETSLKVTLKKLLYRHRIHPDDNDQLFYLCKYVSGEPHLDPESEEIKSLNEDYFEEPVWIEIKSLIVMNVYPFEIRDSFLIDRKNDFKDTPRNVRRS